MIQNDSFAKGLFYRNYKGLQGQSAKNGILAVSDLESHHRARGCSGTLSSILNSVLRQIPYSRQILLPL